MGVREEKVWPNVISGFGLEITCGGGRIYTNTGAVVNAKQGTLVGTIPVAGPVAVNPTAKRVYYVLPQQRRVEAYNTETLVRTASVDLPQAADSRHRLVVVGDTALAFNAKKGVVLVPLKVLEAGNAVAKKDLNSKEESPPSKPGEPPKAAENPKPREVPLVPVAVSNVGGLLTVGLQANDLVYDAARATFTRPWAAKRRGRLKQKLIKSASDEVAPSYRSIMPLTIS